MLAEVDRISDVIDRVVPDALEFLALIEGLESMIAGEDINAVLLVASGFVDFTVDKIFQQLVEGTPWRCQEDGRWLHIVSFDTQ